MEYTSGECTATCGGGVRKREMRCMNEQFSEGPVELCDGSSPPPIVECNTFPCNTPVHSLTVSDWSECSEACGGGIRKRDVLCSDKSGNAIPKKSCR